LFVPLPGMETIKIQRHEMQYRALGKTNIEISALSFGAGPVSSLMVGDDGDRQRAVVRRAVELGINWFDTAATYGAGQSERNLGRVFDELGIAAQVHVATKVRLMPDDLGDIRGAVRRSFEGSLERLQLQRVTLLQLHNSVTRQRGDEPTSVTPRDVLGSGGITEALEQLRAEGLIGHLGLTGIGDPTALKEVVRSGQFATIQVPYHLLNPSAGRSMPAGFAETNYGNIIAACSENQMGVLAIRVLAGGALANHPPGPHTLKTPFFPLELYQRDLRRASCLQTTLGADRQLPREAIRFALSHPSVSSALIGFAEPEQIDEAVASLTSAEPLLDWDMEYDHA
jgi:aryl-alcohol dehydrogenase-like predicted oxidoreductase